MDGLIRSVKGYGPRNVKHHPGIGLIHFQVEGVSIMTDKQDQIKQRCLELEHELIMKVKAGHFQYFQDLFAEVTSPYSDYFGIDPNKVWKSAQE